ncbi:MAG: glycosyltransferase involved in cell wall biosynthesis, partial [Bacteriovoracaceae bacterium]
MKIYYIEPFFGQSHKEWIESYQKYSRHEIQIFSLSGRFWKWRMQGGAIALADQLKSEEVPDLFLISGMIDLPLFKSLLDKKFRDVPLILYFHENQFAYPEGVKAPKNQLHHYAFMNFKSCLASDKAYFNSSYNLESFLKGARKLLKKMPDQVGPNWLTSVQEKSQVLPLGIEAKVSELKEKAGIPLVLWNHRWEHDKNPEEFFKLLFELKDEGYAFELAVLG